MVAKIAAVIGLILGLLTGVIGFLWDGSGRNFLGPAFVMSGAIVFGSGLISMAIATRRQD